jgi:hypothetical protein
MNFNSYKQINFNYRFFKIHFTLFFPLATLTSYSENVERTKYVGESSKELGSGGNLKPWQSQKSNMDSCLYRVDENMTASTYSLNKIPERNLETVLSQSVQSIPLYLMPRPNSVAGKVFCFLIFFNYLTGVYIEMKINPAITVFRFYIHL